MRAPLQKLFVGLLGIGWRLVSDLSAGGYALKYKEIWRRLQILSDRMPVQGCSKRRFQLISWQENGPNSAQYSMVC